MYGLSLYDLHLYFVMDYVKCISYIILLSAGTVLFALILGTTLLWTIYRVSKKMQLTTKLSLVYAVCIWQLIGLYHRVEPSF